ncbi:MobF family relaxase [Kitasatospora sp. NPDC058201]|uniref:MobF family relaxase n=1 Tax=unclassified Kitasatospora TaxID=2633591 RepID=UPI0036541F7A
MTVAFAKMTPGNGYVYLMRQIATGDELRTRGRDLAEHQTAAGVPPGQWSGRAAALLGVSGQVTEAQMRALFGEGLHPRADEIITERLRAGDTPRQARNAARLGAGFYQFGQKPTELALAIEQHTKEWEQRTGRPPTTDERRAIRRQTGAKAFKAEFEREPLDGSELNRYITRRTRPARQPVAAFHTVFRPSKSVSLLWALGDDDVRQTVEKAHEEAIAATLVWIEDNALATRCGPGGVAQHDVTSGLVAAQFRHFDSRCGDALLHDHVLLANKVQGPDGRWRTIDGRLLLAQAVCASEVYNAEVLRRVCSALDLAVTERPSADGRRPVMEIAGIGPGLIKASSVRAAAVRERMPALLDAYRAAHGKEPSLPARIALQHRASLETRPSKKQARPLAVLRENWKLGVAAAFGRPLVDNLLRNAKAAGREVRRDKGPPHLHLDKAAREVVATVSLHRAVFGKRHLLAEAHRYVTRTTGGRAGDGWADRICDHALRQLCLDLTPPDINPAFAPLQRADGTSVYRRRGAELYTTPQILAAEDRIVAAARRPTKPACGEHRFQRIEARHKGPLDPGQRAMAKAFATSDRTLVAAIGPAGAGKTTALRLAANAIGAAGRTTVALAPSARAAHVMAQELGRPAHTLHSWLRRQRLADAGNLVLPRTERLRRGDVIIVDEAGMAATTQLAAIVRRAERAGAHVRLIGDPAQLTAVEAGGVLRLLQSAVGAVHLTEVHRFRHPQEAAASLALRDGDPGEAFAWYRKQGRIQGGDTAAMADAVFTAWRRDLSAGRTPLMTAPDRDLVAALNRRAQAWRMERGQLLKPSRWRPRPAKLRDGHHAHVGDLVVTRQNQRRLTCLSGRDFVKNGDVWAIERYTPTGDAIARHTQHRGRLTLPADYLKAHCELGYASTIHRAQGMTVTRSHALLTTRTSREAAYVAATRGRTGNHLYIALEDDQSLDEALLRIATYSSFAPSARQTIREQQERAWGIGQLHAEYTDAAERATRERYAAAARTALGPPAEALITADAFTAIVNALGRAERTGFTPERILAAAHRERTLAGLDVPGAVLAWRIDRRLRTARAAEAHADADPNPAARLLRTLTDEQLERITALAATHRTRALTELHAADVQAAATPQPVTAAGRRHPAWPQRPYGTFTPGQLADRLRAARRTALRAADEGDHRTELAAVEDLVALRAEQTLRRQMPWRDRCREDHQRTRPGSPATAPDPATAAAADAERAQLRQHAARDAWQRAEAVTARAGAERHLRRMLPDRPPTDTSHEGDLPDWLTPTTALDDPPTPDAWRRHLSARRDIVERHLAARGAQLAADTPAWAAPLGPLPPPQAGAALRAQWERTAALTDAWRILRQIPAHTDGLGPKPDAAQHAAAWDALDARIRALHHRVRTAHQPHPAPTAHLTRQALNQLARVRQLRTTAHPSHPDPGTAAPPPAAASAPDPAAPATDRRPATPLPLPQAEHLGQDALAAALAGRKAPAQWVEQIPAPDENDTGQQHLYRRLVTDIAHWRLRHGVTGTDPLGPPPDRGPGQEWTHLSQALDLYRTARITDRLHLLRVRREEDRERLQTAAQQAAQAAARTPASPPSRPVPGAKSGRPRRPGGRRRR